MMEAIENICPSLPLLEAASLSSRTALGYFQPLLSSFHAPLPVFNSSTPAPYLASFADHDVIAVPVTDPQHIGCHAVPRTGKSELLYGLF